MIASWSHTSWWSVPIVISLKHFKLVRMDACDHISQEITMYHAIKCLLQRNTYVQCEGDCFRSSRCKPKWGVKRPRLLSIDWQSECLAAAADTEDSHSQLNMSEFCSWLVSSSNKLKSSLLIIRSVSEYLCHTSWNLEIKFCWLGRTVGIITRMLQQFTFGFHTEWTLIR